MGNQKRKLRFKVLIYCDEIIYNYSCSFVPFLPSPFLNFKSLRLQYISDRYYILFVSAVKSKLAFQYVEHSKHI